jgi:WD40 repeat protein
MESSHTTKHLNDRVYHAFCLVMILVMLGGCQGVKTSPPTPTLQSNITTPVNTATGETTPTAGISHEVSTPQAPTLVVRLVKSLGKGVVNPILQTPDRKHYLYTDEASLHVVNSATLEDVGVIPGACTMIGSGDFSPDSRYVAIFCGIGTQIVDLKEMQVVGFIKVDTMGSLYASEFSKDSNLVAFKNNDRTSGGSFQSVGVWDIKASKELAILETGEEPSVYHSMTDPVLSPDSRYLAAGYEDSNHSFLLIWNIKTGERLQKILTQTVTNDVAFSPDGAKLASGDVGGMIHLWNPHTGQEIKAYGGFTDSIETLHYLDQTHIKVWAGNQSPKVLNLSSEAIEDFSTVAPVISPLEEQLFSQGLVVHESWNDTGVALSPDGSLVAQFSSRVALYDTTSGEALQLFNPFSDQSVLDLKFDGAAKRMAARGTGGELAVWDTGTGKELYRGLATSGLRAGPGIGAGVWDDDTIALSPDGSRLAAGDGSALQLIDLATGEAWSSDNMQQYDVYITDLVFSLDGTRVYAILNRNRGVQVWDAQNGSVLDEIWLPQPDPNAFTNVGLSWPYFARNNYSISINKEEYWIELWNLETHTYQKLSIPDRYTDPLIFSTDGQMLYALNGKKLYAWRSVDGLPIGHSDDTFYSTSVAASQDGTLLGYMDNGIINIMDASEFTERLEQPDETLPLPPVISPTDFPEAPQPESQSFISLGQGVPSGESRIIPDTPISIGNIGQLNEAGHFSPGTINSLRWEADSSRVIIAGSRSIAGFDPENGTSLLAERNASFTSTATRSDGHLIAAGILNDSVFVYDVTSDEVLASFKGGGKPTLSPDGHFLVYETTDRNLLTYDLERNQALATLLSITTYDDSLVYPIFSPDGSLVAGLQGGRIVRIWNAKTGGMFNALGGPDGMVTDLSFSSDGDFLVAAGTGSAWVWEVRPAGKAQEIKLFEGVVDENLILYQDTVTATGLSHDNRLLAIGTSQHDIRIYFRETGELLQTLKGHAAPITHLLFDPGNKYLLSTDQDGTLILWNPYSGAFITKSNVNTGAITSLITRQDGSVSAFGENTVWVIHPSSASLVKSVSSFFGKILGASPDGKYLAVYQPLQMYLVDASTGELISSLEGEAQDVFVEYYEEGQILQQFYGAQFSHDSRLLATFGAGGLWLYQIDGNTHSLNYQDGSFTTKAVFSLDDRYLFYSPHDLRNSGQKYDLLNNYSAREMNYIGIPEKVAFSSDGNWLAFTLNNWDKPNEVAIWNAKNGIVKKEFPLATSSNLTVLAYNTDDTLIAVGQEDGTILLLNVSTGEILNTLTGHTDSITALAFTHDGLYLVSGSADGTVGFWAVGNP